MKRIAFVCLNAYKVFSPASRAQIGGTEVQMAEIAKKLSLDAQYEISFIVGDFGQQDTEKYGNITVYKSFSLKRQLWSLARAPFAIWRILIRIQPDIIISSPAGPEAGILALYAKIAKKTYIFRAASDVDCTGEKARMMDPVSRFLYELGIHTATTIVVQHERQQRALAAKYHRTSRCIENGYTIPTQLPSAKNDEILWIGSSRTVKRTDLFFEIARSMPEHQFGMILSHSGDEAIYQACKKTAEDIPNVHFYGELSPEDTNNTLAQSRLLLGTSDYEGSPNTYIAAYMRNTPVISLQVPCVGYCADGDIKKMKQKIEQWMIEPAEYHSAQKNAYNKASTYDIDTVITKWISLLQ